MALVILLVLRERVFEDLPRPDIFGLADEQDAEGFEIAGEGTRVQRGRPAQILFRLIEIPVLVV